MSRRDAGKHADDCMCPPCLTADQDQFLLDQGRDPADFPMYMPGRSGGWRTVRPESAAAMLEVDEQDAQRPAPADEDDDDAPAYVFVRHMGAGTWAKFTGVDADGRPVTVSGAIVGGPDPIEGTDELALSIRDGLGGPDRLLIVAGDAHTLMVDDPADHAARAAYAAAPVFPTGSLHVRISRRVPAQRKGRRDTWVEEYITDVPMQQFQVWDRGDDPDVLLLSVAMHHDHLPIGGTR